MENRNLFLKSYPRRQNLFYPPAHCLRVQRRVEFAVGSGETAAGLAWPWVRECPVGVIEGWPGAVCTCPCRYRQIPAPRGQGPHTCPTLARPRGGLCNPFAAAGRSPSGGGRGKPEMPKPRTVFRRVKAKLRAVLFVARPLGQPLRQRAIGCSINPWRG
jgi:hypothetical protein